jgi:hypothetical protein
LPDVIRSLFDHPQPLDQLQSKNRRKASTANGSFANISVPRLPATSGII